MCFQFHSISEEVRNSEHPRRAHRLPSTGATREPRESGLR